MRLTKIIHRALRLKGFYRYSKTGKENLSNSLDRKMNLLLYVVSHPIKAYRRIRRDYTNNKAEDALSNPNPSSQSLY